MFLIQLRMSHSRERVPVGRIFTVSMTVIVTDVTTPIHPCHWSWDVLTVETPRSKVSGDPFWPEAHVGSAPLPTCHCRGRLLICVSLYPVKAVGSGVGEQNGVSVRTVELEDGTWSRQEAYKNTKYLIRLNCFTHDVSNFRDKKNNLLERKEVP